MMQIRNRLAPPREGVGARVETVALPLLALALAHCLRPDDPLLVREPFPWLWLTPILLALRYGALSALIGLTIFLAAWLSLSQPADQGFPSAYFMAGLLLTLICGEFSGIWHTRLRRMEELNRYLDQRLESLSRQLHVTQLSHDQLQQSLIDRPQTLSGVLAELRALIDNQSARNSLPALDSFMHFLARVCQLEAAAFYAVDGTRLAGDALITLGSMPKPIQNDPLIEHALAHQVLSHIQTEAITERPSQYLVAAPLRSSSNRTHALLLIRDMPFFALQHDTMQTLAVLLSYYADSVEASRSANRIREAWPDCPTDFADELFKLIQLQKISGLPSHVVVLTLPRLALHPELFGDLVKQKRNLDLIWEMQSEDSDTLVTLMPLANRAAVDGYRQRITDWLEGRLSIETDRVGIALRSFDLGESHALLQVRQLLEQLND